MLRKAVGLSSRIASALAGVSLLLAALVVAACGDDGTTTTTRSPGATAGAPTRVAAAGLTPITSTAIKVAQGAGVAHLTDDAGFTLYFASLDEPGSGRSACIAISCQAAWPPLIAQGEPAKPADLPGELGTITRTDGLKQITYNGRPLYRFRNDAAPGETKGEIFDDAWTIARP